MIYSAHKLLSTFKSPWDSVVLTSSAAAAIIQWALQRTCSLLEIVYFVFFVALREQWSWNESRWILAAVDGRKMSDAFSFMVFRVIYKSYYWYSCIAVAVFCFTYLLCLQKSLLGCFSQLLFSNKRWWTNKLKKICQMFNAYATFIIKIY